MHIYKELSLVGDKSVLDTLFMEIYNLFPGDWIKPSNSHLLEKYIVADYTGNAADHARVSIYCGDDAFQKEQIQVGNIIPLEKDQITVDEYNKILDLFYKDILIPYSEKHPNIKIVGPTSKVFDPLSYITKEALEKLESFCNMANKSTGSSHPYDEERWFEFICQTVDDEKIFDYDMLYNFLKDEDYWGKREDGFIGVVGEFAWDEKKAAELAFEYISYIRVLISPQEYYQDYPKNLIREI